MYDMAKRKRRKAEFYRTREEQLLELVGDEKDNVNSPSHYTSGAIEVVDYITQVTDHYNGDVGYCIGNVIKYISRAPLKKDEIEDLNKALWYLKKAISLYDMKD